MKKRMDRIKKMYYTHTIAKLLATIIILCLLLWGIWYLPVLQVKKSPLPDRAAVTLLPQGEEIALDAGMVLVAESDSKQLYIDSTTMNVKVKDLVTGMEWNALLPDASDSMEKSLLMVTYLGEDNNVKEYDSFTYCTNIKNYQLFQVENGVQIKMNLSEGESTRFYEYYPVKMPIERFEQFFIEGIESLIKEGKVEEAKGKKYEQTLKLIYKKSIKEECYAVANNGTPPSGASKQLLELAKLLEYNKEMLVEDNETFGITTTFSEPAAFEIILEAVLENNDLLVHIPMEEMVSENDFYTIQNVKVLPNFGAASSEAAGGYILVPDGAGALFEFNSYNPAIPDYIRPVYDNDYFSDYYFMPEYGKELTMPILGMTYGKDEDSTGGFLAIIEEGAKTSYVNVKLAGAGVESGNAFNKVYASFDVTQYNKVKIYGPYSDNKATYLAKTEPMDEMYSIRYRLFADKVTYFDMAISYKEYLKEAAGLSEYKYPREMKLYLNAIGALSLQKRILGIPYDTAYSLTTYQELEEMLKSLGDRKLAVSYSGVFNNGLKNKLNNRADLVASNGSKAELGALKKLVSDKDIDFFYEVALSKVYEKGNGFLSKKHAIYDYANAPATIYRYLPSLGILNGGMSDSVNPYNLVAPRYLSDTVDGFLKDSEEFDSLAIPDLANYYYADYQFKKQVSPYKAEAVIDENLNKLKTKKSLSLFNPLAEYITYGTYATDISRESSDYASFYTTIPFRQLVMNGLTEVTTENVNMSSKNTAYYILQAVELGVYPKFTITSKNIDVLKNSDYSYLYATEYEKQKQTMEEVYDTCKTVWEDIGSMEIINHRRLSEKVYCTEYASGVAVITNYNQKDVSVEGKTIHALSYFVDKQQNK